MTAAEEIVADVLDALYDLAVAVPTLAAAVTANTLSISDGPPSIEWSHGSMLAIGEQPEVEGSEVATVVTWDWATSATSGATADVAGWIEVPCGITTMTGDATATSMRAARRTALGLAAALANAIRGSTLSLGPVMWCICNVNSVKQLQTTSGAECIVNFTARVRVQI